MIVHNGYIEALNLLKKREMTKKRLSLANLSAPNKPYIMDENTKRKIQIK